MNLSHGYSEEENEEYAPIDIPPPYRNINAIESKMAVRELWERYQEQKLDLTPDFQRFFVWDSIRSSRYIESLMLGLPTPAIFISEETSGIYVVLDGHQRLESLFRYMQPLLRGKQPFQHLSPLVMNRLEVLVELNGKGIEALPIEHRKALWETKLPVIIIPATAYPDMKYVLFARLNLGSMSLNGQELRNCIYRGKYNNFIAKCSENHLYLRLWNKNEPDRRMKDRELALSFFAFLHRRPEYRTPFKSFLNDEMEANKHLSVVTQDKFEDEFKTALAWVDRVFGNVAFKQFKMGNAERHESHDGHWVNRRYDLVYEVEMVGFASVMKELNELWSTMTPDQQELFCNALRRSLAGVMVTDSFVISMSEGTKRQSSVNKRFEPWLQMMQHIIRQPWAAIDEERSLTEYMRRNGRCIVCAQNLVRDDAAKTQIDGNVGYAHRICQKTTVDH